MKITNVVARCFWLTAILISSNDGFSQVEKYRGHEYMTNEEREIGHQMVNAYRREMYGFDDTDSCKRLVWLDQFNSTNKTQRTYDYENPPIALGTTETFGNGLKGKWALNKATDPEFGEGVYGHRTDQSQYNAVLDRMYVLNTTRNILVGDRTPNGELALINHNIRIEGNAFVCIIMPDGRSRLIGGISQADGSQSLYYSDDESLTWHMCSGADFQFGQAIWADELDDAQSTILAIVKKYAWEGNWEEKFFLIASTDRGATFNTIDQWYNSNTQQVYGAKIHNTDRCFIVRKSRGSGQIDTYEYKNSGLSLTNTSWLDDLEMRKILGTYTNGKVHLYLNLGDKGYYSNGQNWQYISQNSAWINMIAIHPQDERYLHFMDYDSKFSFDGGYTIQATDWWEYAFGWDPRYMEWYQDIQGNWFVVYCNDFGLHYASDPQQRYGWNHINYDGVHQILHHGDCSDKTGLLVTGNQDRGTMIWEENGDHSLYGSTSAKADGLRACVSNTGNGYWFIHYWGVLYHKSHPIVGDGRIGEIKITDESWYTPPMAPSHHYNEDAVYVAGFDQLKKYVWNSNSNVISEQVFPFNFRAVSGEGLYGIATTPADPNRIYVVTRNGQFFASHDGGYNWTKSAYSGAFPPVSGWPYWGAAGYAIAVSNQNPDLVFLSGDGDAGNGFLVSSDGGMNFSVKTSGMTRYRNQELVLTDDERFVFGTNQMVYDVQQQLWFDLQQGSAPNDGGINGVDYLPSRNTVRYYSWGLGVVDLELEGGSNVPVIKFDNITHHGGIPSGDFQVIVNAEDSDGEVVSVKLYIDGNYFGESSTAPYAFDLSGLSDGPHILQAFAVDNDGYVQSTSETQVESSRMLNATSVSCVKPGIEYEYFQGYWNNLPNFQTLTPVTSGELNQIDIASATDEDGFAFVFSGYLSIDNDDIYRFQLSSDDGSKLTIGHEVIIDNDGLHGYESVTAAIGLRSGMHPIRVEYMENYGGHALDFSWASSAFEWQPISADNLYIESASNCKDCNGETNGTAFIDACGTCVLGSTGETPCPQTNWHFDTDLQDWQMANQVFWSTVDNSLKLDIQGNDPYIISPDSLFIESQTLNYVIVQAKNTTTNTQGQLFWTTTSETTLDEKKSVTFDLIPQDAEFREYIIDLSQHPEWNGYIHQLRLDPVSGGQLGVVFVSSIKVTGSYHGTPIQIPGVVEFEDFNLGGNGSGYSDQEPMNNGGAYRENEGVDLEPCYDIDGNINVGWMANGEWLDYLVDVAKDGLFFIEIRQASFFDRNEIRFYVDGIEIDEPVLTSLTGGVQNWKSDFLSIDLTSGLHNISILIEDVSGGLNLNKMTITSGNITGTNRADHVDQQIISNDNGIIISGGNAKCEQLNVYNLLGQKIQPSSCRALSPEIVEITMDPSTGSVYIIQTGNGFVKVLIK